MADPADAGKVAVVGMAVQVPGAERDLDLFWQHLLDGADAISFFGPDELAEWGVDADLAARPNFVPARAVLEDGYRFDHQLFGYSPADSALIDPQQRALLSCAWSALEHAGYSPVAQDGNRTGVYVGTGMNVYLLDHVLAAGPSVADAAGLKLVIGNDKDFAATRIAYKLNLQGPGFTIQSACSTSLVAVHTAVQSLLTYETDMALAGAATVAPVGRRGYLYEEGGILSPDGRCRTFDAAAQGTVPGDGAGMVVLKRLDDAQRDGDTIHAVIAGSAVNNDGSRKAGFTAPGPIGQAEVIAAALAVAELSPDTIGVVETHGTGTALGDPVEIAGLRAVFDTGTPGRPSCALTAVKSNVGHLDTAAGVVGLIKMVLALKNRTVPPVAHFTAASDRLGLAGTPFHVAAEARPWDPIDGVRRAGVSAFGIGGTNAHVILEEAPPAPECGTDTATQLLVVSAKSEKALDQRLQELAARLGTDGLADVAFTLRTGRTALPWRAAVVAADAGAATVVLSQAGGRRQQVGADVVLVLPDEVSWPAGFGASSYRSDPVYRVTVDEAGDLDSPRLAAFVDTVAYARSLLSRGIRPRALLGHGTGELAAGCVAGALTLGAALDALAHGRPASDLKEPTIPIASSGSDLDPAVWLHIGPVAGDPDGTTLTTCGPDDTDGHAALLSAVGALWQLGIGDAWDEIHDVGRRRVPLPTYPFATTRHVIGAADKKE